ncbi:MAG: asparaginase [Clostridiaceae bacterium]|nr:asparaginase [Clostridiaceae bacterium]
MKKILMLTTGGTISSVPSTQGLRPLGSEEILRHLGSDTEFALDTREIFTLDSSNIQPEEWQTIAREVFSSFDTYDGVVVTHGTDTMAYTASMLTFMLQCPPIPVVLTGSQLPISHLLSDAVPNLRCAFAMACSGVPGVFVAFDRRVLLGCRAVKVRTSGFDAFESINMDPAGWIDTYGLHIDRLVVPRFSGEPELMPELDANVFLMKLTPGANPAVLDQILDSGCRGLVIEAFGAGGVQFIRRDFIARLEKAAQMNVPVVVCSQCLYERSDFSIYQVGQKALETGVIQGLDMTSEAVVTKLMWALPRGGLDEVRKIFGTNYANEVTFL